LILDTNAVSALLSGDQTIAELLAFEQHHHLPTVVIGEYRYGLTRSNRRAGAPRNDVGPLDRALERSCNRFGYDVSLREGSPRIAAEGSADPENDLWIAALASQYSLRIVSRDVHFDEVSGVERVSW